MIQKLLVISLFSICAVSFADDTHSRTTPDATTKSAAKSGRKKRELMCKDCGKPEKHCECKGEEHRKGEHDHSDRHEEQK